MSVFTSLGILFLAVLIQTFLQLTPSVFLIFSHYALGKNSKTKASDLSLFFIIGVEVITTLFFISVYLITYLLFLNQLDLKNGVFNWIIAGILIAISIFIFFCYFKKGPNTNLFIPRKIAKNLSLHAKTIRTRSDAFLLGALSGICELIFTLPLYLIISLEITEFPGNSFAHAGLIIFYILITLLPLFIIHSLYATGHNLAEIQRFRVKNKLFFRIFLSLCYLILAILIIIFRILP